MIRRLALFAVLACAAPAAVLAQGAVQQEPRITTTGEASVKRTPDEAWVSVTVQAREGKAADARRKGAEAMTSLQAALKSVGIAANDIKTVSFSLQPVAGEYAVRNQIEVHVANLDLLGDALDVAGSQKTSGSLSVSIASLRYELKDRDAVEREVLAGAVKDAMRRAEAIAAGAGRAAGAILQIDDQRIDSNRPGPILMRAAAPMGGGAGGRGGGAPVETPITPTDIEVRAQVTLVVAIR